MRYSWASWRIQRASGGNRKGGKKKETSRDRVFGRTFPPRLGFPSRPLRCSDWTPRTALQAAGAKPGPANATDVVRPTSFLTYAAIGCDRHDAPGTAREEGPGSSCLGTPRSSFAGAIGCETAATPAQATGARITGLLFRASAQLDPAVTIICRTAAAE
ncbi:hypothetical protein BDY21DRAFT_360141 [Lineolata rhizophorae]|uniref:Uncharacterized protein n=1 Tax=Lineolata rhizophorae TaxID=578093 RepID=A0A6A6PDV7_9PEZI|nr:hypothetical protein BDY21DRAFT_360141 [Lineolata rhizophorae]